MPTASFRSSSHILRSASVVVVMMAAVLLAACATAPAPASATCQSGWTSEDYAAARVIRRIRLYTDPATGDSAMEETTYAPKSTPLMKTGTILREYDFGPAKKVQIVAGPANLVLPLHPSPYPESFLVLKGNVSLKLANGQERMLVPGDLTVMEDTTASKGHGGLTGPCGYVSLNIVP